MLFFLGLGFLVFEHLKSLVCTKLGNKKFRCLVTQEPPPVYFKSSVYCLHVMPPFFSLHYRPKIYRYIACCFYSGCPYLLLWCGSLYLPLRNYGGSPLNNCCRRFIQLPSHIFSLFILFSHLFSFIASAATARSNLIRRGQSFIGFDR